MRKLFQLFLLILSFSLHAQKVGKTPLKDIKTPYLKINISTRGNVFQPFERKVFVDFGQISRQSEIGEGFLYDNNGDEKIFSGIMDALNFFHEYGWELDNAFPLGCCDPTEVDYFHYILKRRNVKRTDN